MRLTVTLNDAPAPKTLRDDLAKAFAKRTELALLMGLLDDADLHVRLETTGKHACAKISLNPGFPKPS